MTNVNPFENLRIGSHAALEKVKSRAKCPKCNASRKYFCYKCHIPMTQVAGTYETIQLPLMIDIIKHPLELDGKSTAVHAKLLAPDHVTIYTFPDIPRYDKEKVVVVFPSKDAVSLEELLANKKKINQIPRADAGSRCDRNECCKHRQQLAEDVRLNAQNESSVVGVEPGDIGDRKSSNSETRTTEEWLPVKSPFSDAGRREIITDSTTSAAQSGQEPYLLSVCAEEDLSDTQQTGLARSVESQYEEGSSFHRVVFIDSTWNQCKAISRDDRLAGLPRVILEERLTTFWRTQTNKPATYLATIEAIYYFLIDYHRISLGQDYRGQYDNLLYFYTFMHSLVRRTLADRELVLGSKPSKLQRTGLKRVTCKETARKVSEGNVS